MRGPVYLHENTSKTAYTHKFTHNKLFVARIKLNNLNV